MYLLADVHSYYYILNNVVKIFVVETILSCQVAWVSVFSSSNLLL